MKDYSKQITYKSLNNIVAYTVNNGYTFEVVEGVLNDVYVIDTNKEFTVGRVKPRDFIILYPKFASSWSNTFHILMTNDKNKVKEFYALSNPNLSKLQ